MSEEFQHGATIGEIYDPAMAVQSEEEAEAYLQRIIRYMQRETTEMPESDARQIALKNIGYWTGYYDHATADRVMALYHTAHPIFGTSHPTLAETFAKGIEMGQAAQLKKGQA